MADLVRFTGFEWDKGNLDKNWLKHKVSHTETEEIFFNEPLLLMPDRNHSTTEPRYHALGMTNSDRLLFISFTQRRSLIRIISARPMNKKEARLFHEKAQENPPF